MTIFVDIKELFTSPKDPNHLSWNQFVTKEESRVKTALAELPEEVQPLLDVGVESVANLASAAAIVAGTSVGNLISEEVPNVESWFLGLLGRAFGTTNAADIAAMAKSPAGQTIIAQIGGAASALVDHLSTQASAGLLGIAQAAAPAAPAPLTAAQGSTAIPVQVHE